ADERTLAKALDARLVELGELDRGHVGRLERRQDSAIAVEARQCARGEVVLRLFHGVGGERPNAQPRAWLWMACARTIGALVELDRLLAGCGVAEEPGVAVGQAEQCGDLGAIV